MIKLKKILKILLGVIGALVLLLVLTVLFWLGPTVKLIAKTIGPRALGTEVHIDKLSINPVKGVIRLSDFAIKNPDVFGQTNAVSLESLDISVDMASLFSPTIIVHKVEINSPYFIYEQDLQSDNISEFIANVQAFAGIDPEAPPKARKEKQTSKNPPKMVIVEQLAINDVQIYLANTYDDKLDMGIGLDSLTVSMTNGHTRLDNFYVKNPGRLQSPNLFTLDGIDIQMEPGSVFTTNIHFQSVEILNPHAFIEHNPETDTVGEFLKIANSLVAKIPTNQPTAEATNAVEIAEQESVPQAPSPEVTIDSIIIDDVQVHAINIGEPELDVHLGMSYLSVALERGEIRMENLQLSNPAKFASQDIFSLEQFSIQLAPGSYKEDTVIIEDVQVTEPHVYLELNTNFNTVSEFLQIANGYIERIPTYQIPSIPVPPIPSTDPDEKVSITNAPSAPPFELYNLFVDDVAIHLLDTTPTNNPFPQPSILFGIDDISVKLFQGEISLDTIRVPNPEGFNASNLFHLAQIAIDIDPSTIHSDQVVIREVFIDSPHVDLEQTETIGNVAQLQTTLMQFNPTPDQLPKLPEQPAVASTEELRDTPPTNTPVPIAEQPVVLNKLLVTNLAVNLTFPVITNETGGVMSSIGMDRVSLDKLNPMGGGAPGEEVDPNAPMTILAFDRLSLEPLKGLLYLDGLRLSNPPGFSRRDLVKVEHFRLDIDPDSIQTDTLHIEDILIQKPRIRYERQISTDNIKALQAEIEMATMRRQETMGTAPDTNTVQQAEANVAAEAQPTEEEGQKVIIDRILIPNGLVQAKLSALPSIPVPLPTIEITDLGKEEGGASLAEANETIFNTLYESILGAVGNTTGFATDALKGIGGLTFDAMGDALGGVSDGIGNVTRDATDAVKETAEKVRNRSSRKRRAGGKRSAVH